MCLVFGVWVWCVVCGVCRVAGGGWREVRVVRVVRVVCGEGPEGWRGEAGLLCCWCNAPGPFALGIHCTVADSMCPSLDDVVAADRP